MAKQLKDRDKILDALKGVSPAIVSHISSHPRADYLLVWKKITHSDLCGGKRTSPAQGNDRNILYYLTVDEMDSMGLALVAHQSNLLIPSAVYNALSVTPLKDVVIEFTLVNDSAEYFTPDYTIPVVHALGKVFPWRPEECSYVMDKGPFTSMHMTYGDHGVGTSNDPEFQALRKNVFVDDVAYFLVENLGFTKRLYIILSKAEKFYDVLSLAGKEPEPEVASSEVMTTETEVRTEQDIWKDRLAEEMMRHASSDTDVFCPLTGIRGPYEKLKMLFIASHIKAYANCEEHEKYDVNNGLLLTAGADALFDKYMITISEEKDIVFSFLIADNEELKRSLCLDKEVFREIFTSERMEYIKEHRRIFLEKERERRSKMSATSGDTIPVPSAGSVEDAMADRCVDIKRDELEGVCLSAGAEGTFLVAPYENILHKRWIIRNRMFNSLMTKADLHGASVHSCPETIVLYDKYDVDNYIAFGIDDCGYLEGSAMSGSPQTLSADQSYLIFRLGHERKVSLDINALLRHVDSKYEVDPTVELIMIKN